MIKNMFILVGSFILMAAIAIFSCLYIFRPQGIKVKDIQWSKTIYTERYERIITGNWEELVPKDKVIVGVQDKYLGLDENGEEIYRKWVRYEENQWRIGRTFSTMGRKSEIEYWPEVHTSEFSNHVEPIVGDMRIVQKVERYFILDEDNLRHYIDRETYDKLNIGDYYYEEKES